MLRFNKQFAIEVDLCMEIVGQKCQPEMLISVSKQNPYTQYVCVNSE